MPLGLILFLLIALPCGAAEPLPEEMADEIRQSAAEVETLSSRFVQEKFLSMFAETLTSNRAVLLPAAGSVTLGVN